MPSPPLSKFSACMVPGIGAGDPENGVDVPVAALKILVVSLTTCPGDEERYVDGLRTISSSCTPSSRAWTRSVCVPDAANETVDCCESQYAPPTQPQPE